MSTCSTCAFWDQKSIIDDNGDLKLRNGEIIASCDYPIFNSIIPESVEKVTFKKMKWNKGTRCPVWKLYEGKHHVFLL